MPSEPNPYESPILTSRPTKKPREVSSWRWYVYFHLFTVICFTIAQLTKDWFQEFPTPIFVLRQLIVLPAIAVGPMVLGGLVVDPGLLLAAMVRRNKLYLKLAVADGLITVASFLVLQSVYQ